MGGEPYWYFVKYKPDLDSVLRELRDREFRAGRYNPAMPFLSFPLDLNRPGPGARHGSIEEAFEEADADGTRSILDMERVGDEQDFQVVAPLARETLLELFGTERPTREAVEESEEMFDALERGMGVYVIIYEG